MTAVTETRLVRTHVDGSGDTLILREPGDSVPVSLLSENPPTDDVLAVSYEGPRRFLEAWGTRAGSRPRNVGVVSVGAGMRAASAADAGGTAGGVQNVVRGVADPATPAAVHRAVEEYLDSYPEDGRTVVYFDSVNALVDRVGADRAQNFLEDFLRSLAAYDAEAYCCLTPDDHDYDCLHEIRALFDTVVAVDRSADGSVASATVPEPSVDDCFTAVRTSTRRHALATLRAADGELDTAELAGRVASGGDPDERHSMQISLVQKHLPKLSECGFVAHDRERGRVSRGPHFDRIRPYLRLGESEV